MPGYSDLNSLLKLLCIRTNLMSVTSKQKTHFSLFLFSSGKAMLWSARKTSGPIARGAVGVLTYYIPVLDKTLAVMYSVPFDYNLYRNWWNVKLYSGRLEASKKTFREMYRSDKVERGPFKGDNTWHTKKLGSGLCVKGAMGSTGQSKLEITVGIESKK